MRQFESVSTMRRKSDCECDQDRSRNAFLHFLEGEFTILFYT